MRSVPGRRIDALLTSTLAHGVLALLVGLVAAVAAAGLTSRTEGAVGVGTVELRVSAGRAPRTALVLPPLGAVSARTHGLPAIVTAEVKALDFERLQDLANSADPAADARADAVRGFERQLRRLALRLVVLSAVVGAAATLVIPRRRWRYVLIGGGGGVLGAALLLGAVWRGYDVGAFEREPTFDGELERAPALLATVRRHVDDIDVVRSRIGTLGARIAEMYTAAAGETDAPSSGTRILHVSDVHSNPLGIEVIRRLVGSFDIDAVLDTGDLTSFGHAIEARVADLIADIDVRYLLVPGNHDSAANRSAFEDVANIEVLGREIVTVGGVSIVGVPDPTFTADNNVTTADANAAKLRSAPGVSRLVRRLDPDVLAVHDIRQATYVTGHVPLVVGGHTHERSASFDGGTLTLTVGSTGATGLGSFTTDTDLAYEAQILNFVAGRLVAIDYISLRGFDGSFTVEHEVIGPDAGGAVAEPATRSGVPS